MFKKVLFRGTVLIGSFIATVKMLDKIEETDKKRKEAKTKNKNSKKVNNEVTDEEVKQKFRELDKLVDEFEEELAYRQK